MSSTSNLSTDIAVTQEYFEKRNLEEREFTSSLLKNAQKPVIPSGYRDVAHFHRWNKFGLAEDVAEGADPATGEAADIVEYKVELAEIAKHIRIPKYGDAQRFSSLIEQAYDKFAEQAERTINHKLVVAIDAGLVSGNSSYPAFHPLYANLKSGFGQLASDSNANVKDIQRAVSYINKQGFSDAGKTVCSIGPWALEDMMTQDEDFRQFVKYGGKDYLEKGQLGMWAGASFEIQHEVMRETLGGTESTYAGAGEVSTTYVYVKEVSHGVVQFSGFNGIRPKFKVQDISLTGASLSIGYRVPQGCLVTNEYAGVRYKSVNSNNEVASVTA
jgi:N4-gp56 family major capsid protein